ncbi:MAG: nickel pincer cofactor biosynthesis protein LarC [Actinobacteria bacterium]|nr:nickel pincer cofactor biosynthesis protein LarC [Actinomycetota bacterium]
MKKILYIDCFSGISGDMMAGALIDMGVEISYISNQLKKINISGYDIRTEKIKINSVSATHFIVENKIQQPSRNYKEIKSLIENSALNKNTIKLSLKIFEEIAKAESKVHEVDLDNIHFHEIGALDSIIDIVTTASGLDKLDFNPDSNLIYSRMIPLGKGTVQTIHGTIPIPAPATLEILKGIPVYGGDFDFEVTTPTGAAIIKAIAKKFGDIPEIKIEKIGMGTGSKHNTKTPNILRLIIGSVPEKENLSWSTEAFALKNNLNFENLILIATNIDDSNPEVVSFLLEKLLSEKVLDAWVEPVFMKKNRQAFKLCVLIPGTSQKIFGDIMKLIFKESTTFGIRVEEIKRLSLSREIKLIKLPYGEVKIKIGKFNDREITISPEFESCAELARKTGKPIKDIYRDAVFFRSIK